MIELQTSVLIVGAGPTGLALAIELGSRGIRCIVVERNDRVGYAPRAKTTHTRTRAHLRRWGIADKLAAASPFGVEYPSSILFVTRLAGHQLARFENAFNCAPGRNDLYPEHAQWVPQYRLEEVLRARAATLPTVDLRFNIDVRSVEQDASGVRAQGVDTASGAELLIRCDYLVGADGARSLVRDRIGARMEGTYGLSRNFNIIFRAPGLAAAHPHGPGIMYWQVNTDIPSVVGPMDRDDLWYFMPSHVPADLRLTDASAGALIRKATGIDLPYEILSSDEWVASRFVADKYRQGRIFIAGDACHLHPPLGGYGMNMSVADSVDLGWKLAAVLDGWADPSLLDSYEGERRPVHRRVVDEAVVNHAAAAAVLRPGLEDAGPAGDALRREVGDLIRGTRVQEFRSLGVVLGYSYAGSPFVAAEDAAPPALSITEYRPSAYPGRLAPHAWLADGSSLYDLFGAGFTLLVMEDGADAGTAARDAARMGVPLTIARPSAPGLAALYGAGLALIRPDQHVAWRGDAWPGGEILARVTGRHEMEEN
ncbi:FAD-dependent monooxygenase [Niveispirillum sp. KHB5.9]|uniref:FAD-dependent monooxygenase n=1 Tax=Niveispirillum sp. KHB5.9 TaxID=3400269 RepID=UPI003A885461